MSKSWRLKGKAASLTFSKLVKERKTTMSSVTTQADKGLFSTFLAIHHISNEDEGNDKPEEKPSEDVKSMQGARGYQPSRASWHTVTGKIRSYLA